MIKLLKLIATFFGIGYMGKGGGTVAAIVFAILWIVASPDVQDRYWQIIMLLVIATLGVWSGNVVEGIWGKDSSKVVIDEVVGMMITVLLLPATWINVSIGLLLFRFFDIAKPLGIKKLEALPGGWGVMADDVLAGLYARMLLGFLIRLQLW